MHIFSTSILKFQLKIFLKIFLKKLFKNEKYEEKNSLCHSRPIEPVQLGSFRCLLFEEPNYPVHRMSILQMSLLWWAMRYLLN